MIFLLFSYWKKKKTRVINLLLRRNLTNFSVNFEAQINPLFQINRPFYRPHNWADVSNRYLLGLPNSHAITWSPLRGSICWLANLIKERVIFSFWLYTRCDPQWDDFQYFLYNKKVCFLPFYFKYRVISSFQSNNSKNLIELFYKFNK